MACEHDFIVRWHDFVACASDFMVFEHWLVVFEHEFMVFEHDRCVAPATSGVAATSPTMFATSLECGDRSHRFDSVPGTRTHKAATAAVSKRSRRCLSRRRRGLAAAGGERSVAPG
jgi:hypothetical protein